MTDIVVPANLTVTFDDIPAGEYTEAIVVSEWRWRVFQTNPAVGNFEIYASADKTTWSVGLTGGVNFYVMPEALRPAFLRLKNLNGEGAITVSLFLAAIP